jgi:serine/threonine protein phosphatase 1
MNMQAPELVRFSKNNTGQDYVVGDIHGCYELLMTRLDAVKFDRKHDRLFSVGDLVDRGRDSFRCLKLPLEPWFFAVRGNHELLMRDALNGKNELLWIQNGGIWGLDYDTDILRELVNKIVGNLPLAIEVETSTGQVGIIHADVTSGTWGRFSETHDTLSRERIKMREGYLEPVKGIDRVYVGHSILEAPLKLGNVIHIDTGPAHTNTLTILNLADKPPD